MTKQYKVVARVLRDKKIMGTSYKSDSYTTLYETELQSVLDEYAGMGWQLVSTNIQARQNFYVLVHLYFERDS